MFTNKSSKILIVDDIPKNIQVLANSLEHLGHKLAFATNGADTLKYVANEKFDLILLDISMPYMDGIEVCKTIKKNIATAEIPIIFITAFDDKENLVKAFEAGGIDYITKPFNRTELIARVKTHLNLKHSREHIKKMNIVLEEKVEQRTKELFEANEKLQVLEKAKGDFLKLISHELRTPLIGIKGFAEILEETADEENKEYINHLMESADRLVRFSETALLITSLKSKQLTLSYRNTNMKTLLTQLIQSRERILEDKKLKVNCFCDDEDTKTGMDEHLIYKALENIFDNAIKFSPENSNIDLVLSKDENQLSVTFMDNGNGFSEESLEELFDFFSTDDVMHHSTGFGLGLAAVKLILDTHGGVITVNNKENNNGAIVKVSLPITVFEEVEV